MNPFHATPGDNHSSDKWMIEIFCYAGGFAGNIGHDPHILYTLSAVQVLALFDNLDVLDVDKVSNCILIHMAICS